MKNFVVGSLAAGAFSLALCGTAIGQEATTTTITKTPTTVTKTVQHPDGSYTVIEYPVGKETIVTLDPVALKEAGGTATILRDDNGTRIKINMTGIPKEVTAINLYAVDPDGVVTSLGPVVLADGVGSFAGTTPLSKFMIVAAPESTLTTYDPTATTVLFRSAVPAGFSVIPHKATPVGEKVVATAATTATKETPVTTVTPVTKETAVTTVTPATKETAVTTVTPATKETAVTTVTPATKETPVTAVTTVTKETPVATTATTTTTTAYTVPMLNIPAYKKGDDTKMKVNFSGALTGTRANVFITPRKDGPTEVKLRFHELKDAPAGQTYTVWAVSPDNKFIKLGQIVNAAGRNEAEIKSEVALPDFGLFVTMEDANGNVVNPAGPSIGFVEIVK